MGYILPLAHYQYKDYQKRVTADKQDRFFVEKSYKAILETQYNQIEQEANRAENKPAKKTFPQTAPGKLVPEKIYAELTGKGIRFSESI